MLVWKLIHVNSRGCSMARIVIYNKYITYPTKNNIKSIATQGVLSGQNNDPISVRPPSNSPMRGFIAKHETELWMLAKNWSDILSWSWLNIWFEPMRWFVLGHVTGINSATTTCQPRPANHDLCVSLAFEPIKKSSLRPQYALRSYWYGNSYFIHILDKKTIQNGILSTGWHLISFKIFYCYVSLKF